MCSRPTACEERGGDRQSPDANWLGGGKRLYQAFP